MTVKHKVPFQSRNKGKCDTCSDDKPLDMMVRVNYEKGRYECIDCKVSKEEINFIMKDESNHKQIDLTVNVSKIRKAVKWCLG